MDRRNILKSALAGTSVLAMHPSLLMAADAGNVRRKLEYLEHKRGGRLGVAILDSGSGQRTGFRDHERFLLCSTFKLLLVAAVLSRIDRGEEQLDRRLVFAQDAVLEYAPVTSKHVGAPGMTIAELCQAAIALSDNTAANVLMKPLGGPAAVTAYARQLGDAITRLDRMEPELNSPTPDGLSDTTTPSAMLDDLHKLISSDALSAGSRQRLIDWLCETSTGLTSLRAGVPADWRVGDKTGNNHGQKNDVAVMWPPKRKPLFIAVYYENAAVSNEARAAVLAEIARLLK